jgi:CDP-diacylglycerol--glycerol-3-phosphate 3-phosphatidyltransferase
MLLSAWRQERGWFAALFLYALASDAIDGTVARKTGSASPLGARLDSIADAAVYLSVPPAALLLYPVLREREAITLVVILLGYVVPIAIGYAKYRRLTAYHTLAARAAGILLGIAFILFVALGLTWPLRVAAAILVISAIEEVAITALLPAWRANVGSVAHALRSRGLTP